MSETSADHAFIAFIKNNLFPIFGIIGMLMTLWGTNQRLSLEGEQKLNSQIDLGQAQAITELKADKADREVIQIQYDSLKNDNAEIKKTLDYLVKIHQQNPQDNR